MFMGSFVFSLKDYRNSRVIILILESVDLDSDLGGSISYLAANLSLPSKVNLFVDGLLKNQL